MMAAECPLPTDESTPLPAPRALAEQIPLTRAGTATVERGRNELRAILAGLDPRWVVIVGPCSLHDREAALEYADRLRRLARDVDDALLVIMRTYVEKPRSTVGWKGLVNDPFLDGSCDLASGIARSREWLAAINSLGLPCASELLDPIAARYLEDLLAWGGIGARTAESQPHRELASAFPAPIGIKNGTHGDLQGALDAVVTARAPHVSLAIDAEGRASARRSPGNPAAHLVLRGGSQGPNCDASTVEGAARELRQSGGLARPVLVDCSHGNSGKDPTRQAGVLRALLGRRPGPSRGLAGVLLESHLIAGRQPWRPGTPPRPGQSITDACIGWEETERLLRDAAEHLRKRAARR